MDVLYRYINKRGVQKMKIIIESPIYNNGKKTNLYHYYYVTDDNERISGTFQSSLDYINQRKKELKELKKGV